jgi:MSHA pilin protein MshD
MGTGQTLLTIAAMMMISRMVLSVNNQNAQSGGSIEMAAYRITATSLGTSVIEEASGLAFDELSDSNGISTPSSFTAVNKLGPDNGEVYPHYDDFDDFNGLHKIDSLAGSAVFATDVTVQYVSITSNVITVANTQTYNKQITVKVSSKWMSDTLKFYNVMSYWFFR